MGKNICSGTHRALQLWTDIERSSSMNRLQYAPPPLNRSLICTLMLGKYPSHKGSVDLIKELVNEYVKLWHLALEYKTQRIVAPGPIVAVQVVHRDWCPSYFDDCMAYFDRYILPEDFAWQGKTDLLGVQETVDAYRNVHQHRPPVQWKDLLDVYYLGRPKLTVVH